MQGRILSMGLAAAPLVPTVPQATCTAATMVCQAPVPLTKHAAPSWDGAGCGELGDLCSGDTGEEVPATAAARDTPGSGRGRRQAALGALTVFSLLSVPDLPPAPLYLCSASLWDGNSPRGSLLTLRLHLKDPLFIQSCANCRPGNRAETLMQPPF